MLPENDQRGSLRQYVCAGLVYVFALSVLWRAVRFAANEGETAAAAETSSLLRALAVDAALCLQFVVVHSAVASAQGRALLAGVAGPGLARSSAVLFTSLSLAIVVASPLWRPTSAEHALWAARGSVAWLLAGVRGAGLLLVAGQSLCFGHLRLFGLRQAWLFAQSRRRVLSAAEAAELAAEGDAHARSAHPFLLGVFCVLWCARTLTLDRALFAAFCTAFALTSSGLTRADSAEIKRRAQALP